MFESYTEKARRTLYFARSEASEFGSPCIESQHLLLGLLRESKAFVKLFPKPDVAVDMVRKHIEEHSPVRERISISIDLPISDQCQRILLQASVKAEQDQVAREVERLDAALAALNGSHGKLRGTLSASAQARIAAAQRARWTKVQAGNKGNVVTMPKKQNRHLIPPNISLAFSRVC